MDAQVIRTTALTIATNLYRKRYETQARLAVGEAPPIDLRELFALADDIERDLSGETPIIEPAPNMPLVMKLSVSELDEVCDAVAAALARAGVYTIGDLTKCSPNVILAMKRKGPICVRRIQMEAKNRWGIEVLTK